MQNSLAKELDYSIVIPTIESDLTLTLYWGVVLQKYENEIRKYGFLFGDKVAHGTKPNIYGFLVTLGKDEVYFIYHIFVDKLVIIFFIKKQPLTPHAAT